jgi:hypothetical protein
LKKKDIIGISSGDQTIEHGADSVRVDVVPEDQRGLRERDLVRVGYGSINKNGFLRAKKVPLLIRRVPEMTIEQVRELIKTGLQLRDEVVPRLRFVVRARFAGQLGRFDPKTVLKKDDMIGTVLRNSEDTLVVVLPEDMAVGRTEIVIKA